MKGRNGNIIIEPVLVAKYRQQEGRIGGGKDALSN